MKKNIKKKRKVTVPAAQFGVQVPSFQINTPTLQDYYNDYQTQLKLGDTAGMYEQKYGTNPNDERLYNLTLQGLKNTAGNIDKLNSIKDTGALKGGSSKLAAGLGKAAGIMEAIPGAINTLTSPFQTSTATTGGEAAMQSVTGIAEGIGSGAQLGSAIGGPAGAAVGGAVGAVVGLIGKKGRKAGMTSFTDYDEGTLSTGLMGVFNNKKLRARRAAVKNNAYANRQAVIGTANLANEWAEDNIDYDTNTFAEGGQIPTSLAYVDDGELIQTPYGITQVPEQGQPTDSNLVNLPEGSRVLSNTLKVPGTKKTFAQLGEKMMTKKRSKGKDIYAQNSDMLNEMNNNIMHDKLFNMQEAIKIKKGIKNKSKSVDTFQIGGYSSRHNTINVDNTRYNLGDTFSYKGVTYKVTGTNEATPIKARDTWGIKGDVTAPWDDYGRPSEIDGGKLQEVTISAPRLRKPVVKNTVTTKKAALEEDNFSDSYDNDNWIPPTIAPNIDTVLDMPTEDEQRKALSVSPTIQDIPYHKTKRGIRREKLANATDGLSGLVSGITSLAPIMSNLFTKDPEAVPANYNPYANAITNTMSRRRYNIDPLLRDIDTNRSIANYAASQSRTNTGQDMAFRLQTATAADRAKAQARATESNINNQYKADYANTMNNLGQQWVSATNMASDLNARNRAAARNIRRTGLGQLSQWAQNRDLMRNQKSRDDAMMKLYGPFLEAGFTSADLSAFNKYLRKGGNR